ncbi:hypothetical protein D7I46_11235 [Lactococcus allomyrinae]|uniref:Uncharacterized protein n=1 Tax=Lactococcus allomyrinae TaxID=2419773 RepID=A0A387BSY2_9LACT|nr:hypothetical protein D7I46_11235 [Lactococcus allomyrinae]
MQSEVQVDPTKVNPDIIEFSNGFSIGPGIRHSAEEAFSIMGYMLQMKGLPLLTDLNGKETESIVFHQPDRGRAALTFTNFSGEAIAELPLGPVAITTRSGTFQKLVTISKEKQKIDLDIANLDNRLKISFEASKGDSLTDFGRYVVESGQRNFLSFKVIISKNFNRLGGAFVLTPSPNLVIDSVTPDSNIEGFDVSAITGSGTNPSESLSQQLIVPALSNNLVLTVKAHVISTPVGSISPGGSTISISGTDDNALAASAKSPAVVLTGINFAMANEQGNKLVTNRQYLLGRYVKNGYEIYSATQGWVKEESLKEVNLEKVTVLRGGLQYMIGNSEILPIPKATSRFNFNAKENGKINQSLIQIIGLAEGSNYFMYPVENSTDKELLLKPINFSVFARFSITRDGVLITKNSIGEARNQNFSFNTSIPDFQSGVNEYNVLSIGQKKSNEFNAQIKIILPIVLLTLLIVVIGIIAAIIL